VELAKLLYFMKQYEKEVEEERREIEKARR